MGVGQRIARLLVERGLAACVQVVPGARSTYVWEGKIEESAEALIFIKTAMPEAAIEALREAHPYALPEALVFRSDGGLAGYLDWVRSVSPKGG